MKREKFGATALSSLLVLLLAVFCIFGNTVLAATMATVDMLPNLDAQVDKPTAMAVDDQGRIYVAESLKNRVRIFAQGGGLLATLSDLSKPVSVAVDPGGRIYVGSAWKGNVTVFSSGLNELFKLGDGDGEFIQPADIDIAADGLIYVVDMEKSTIQVYSPSGQKLKNIGTPGSGAGQLHHPTSLAIEPASSELVILDHQQINDPMAGYLIDGARIQYFNTDGTFLRGYGKFGYDMNAGQLSRPIQLAVDEASRIYVTDTWLNRVLIYSNTNDFLGMINNSAAPLRTPLGLSIAATGRLYVASMLSGRVNVFGLDNYAAMDVLPAALGFTATVGGNAPAPQDATITNSGKTELAWTAATTTPWLSLPATAGTLQAAATGTVPVSVQAEGLAPGTYQGNFKVTSPGMEEEVAVTMTVRANPLLVSPSSLTFTATEGSTPATQSLDITNGDTELLSWSAAADQEWLSLSKADGSTPDTDTTNVYAVTTNLAPGTYTGTITVNNLTAGGSVDVGVTLTITKSTAPPIEVPVLPQPGGGVVKAGGKNWSMVQPLSGVALRGIWADGRKDMLAVGDGGTVLANSGKEWTTLSSGTLSALHSVWGSSPQDVYTVGASGTVLRYDGKKWAPVAAGTDETLLDVWGTANTEVLAVGINGTIFAGSFTAPASASGVALRSIWSSSATDAFVVGESGTIIHYDGATWTNMTSGTSQWLNAVWGSSAADVFVVGENGTIIHYDGAAWSAMESGVGESLHGVFGNAPDNVYAVGDNGVVLHYDGTAWQVILAGGVSLHDVWTGDKLVVAVGDDGMVLTGKAGTFPWQVIHQNIAIVGQEKRKDSVKKNKSGKDLRAPAPKGPLTK
ncbi:MAG: BACON domain-containing protein [Desulfobulbaceae bacterium]